MYLPLLKAMVPFYYFFCLVMIFIGGVPDYSENIDGVEIKNICDLMRNYVIDDSRDAFGPITLLMITPFFIMAIIKKFKSWFANISFLVLLFFWLWSFYIQYNNCN